MASESGQEKDETGYWMTGSAHLNAAFHGDERFGGKAGQPEMADIVYYVGSGEEGKQRAKEIAKGFARSAGVRCSTASGIRRGREFVMLYTVGGRVNFTPDKTTGELNEAGAKRYKQIVKGFEKQGIAVEVPMRVQYANAFKSRKEFEVALAKYMGESIEEVEGL